MNLFIVILILAFFAWIVYAIQKRIGEEQARDWKEFVKNNPHLFKQPETKSPIAAKDTEEKKNM